MSGAGKKRTALNALFALLLLVCALNPAQGAEFTGKVTAVVDGDTVMALRNGQVVKIRLAGIDAPEKEQDFGQESRQSLIALVQGKLVHVSTLAIDDYDRLVAKISVAGLNVNQEQVRRGMAWNYSRSNKNTTLAEMEKAARVTRLGLWSQADPVSPSIWRKTHMVSSPLQAMRAVTCAGKHRCGQMGSCVEAKFYLSHCGLKFLDSDGDGMPCESLCSAKD